MSRHDMFRAVTESLSQLEDAGDKIFTSITDRVRLHHQQLRRFSTRIQAAQTKVQSISGTSRATTVFSSVKYPEIDASLTDYKSIFQRDGDDNSKPLLVTVSLNTGQVQNADEGTLELFQFFSETSHEQWLKDHKRKDGIGEVTSRVKSVSDVLLFNSSELPYLNYKIVDNFARSEPLSEEEQEEKLKPLPLPAAPRSVLEGDESHILREAEQYGFKPVLRQVPSFRLPSVLPDLPMVANLTWTASDYDRLHSIAPSALHAGLSSLGSQHGSSRFDPSPISAKVDHGTAASDLDSTSVYGGTEEVTSKRTSLVGGVDHSPSERKSKRNLFNSVEQPLQPPRDGTNDILETKQTMVSTTPLPPPPPPLPAPSPPPPPPPPPPLPSNPGPSSRRPNVSGSPESSSSRPLTAASNIAGAPSQPLLPSIDTQRAALMASIRESGMNALRKVGRDEGSVSPAVNDVRILDRGDEDQQSLKPTAPGAKAPLNVMAEMRKSITLRRMSMMGQDQSPRKDVIQPSVAERDQVLVPKDSANIEQRNSLSDDDDDDSWD